MDFTLFTYRNLLKSIQKAGYKFYTFADFCEGKAQGRFVILRHDVDMKPYHSLAIARVEAEMGINSTYFFRTSPFIFKPQIISEIQQLGHEIGYHYRDLVDAGGDMNRAIQLFQSNLNKLRSVSEVRTIAMDGCPWSKYDNRNLWNVYNYSDYGIIGEPYFDFLNKNIQSANFKALYFTDTARMWDGNKYNLRDKVQQSPNQFADRTSTVPNIHSTTNFIDWLNSNPAQDIIMITTHPQRWTDNVVEWIVEFVMQSLKNGLKRFLVKG